MEVSSFLRMRKTNSFVMENIDNMSGFNRKVIEENTTLLDRQAWTFHPLAIVIYVVMQTIISNSYYFASHPNCKSSVQVAVWVDSIKFGALSCFVMQCCVILARLGALKVDSNSKQPSISKLSKNILHC